MVAATPLYPTRAPELNEEPRVLLDGVSWATYVMLRDSVDSPGVRMTYLEGRLEIMSPSRAHEVEKKQIARLLELFCLERDIPLFGYGSTTFRKEEEARGLEPDECYARGEDKAVPDIALEVIKSHGAIDKLEIYRRLGVREIWLFEDGEFRILELQGSAYVPIAKSSVLPEAPLDRVAHYALGADQHRALREFRDELRA